MEHYNFIIYEFQYCLLLTTKKDAGVQGVPQY